MADTFVNYFAFNFTVDNSGLPSNTLQCSWDEELQHADINEEIVLEKLNALTTSSGYHSSANTRTM